MKPLRITAVLLALLVIPLFASQVFSATFAHLDTTYVPWDTIGKYTDDQPLLGFRIDGVSGPSEYLESVTVKSFITKAFSTDRLKLYAESNGTKGLQVPGDLKIGEVNTHDLAFEAYDTLKFFALHYALNETPDSNLFYVAVDANTDSISANLPLYHGQLLEAIIMPGRIVLTSMSNPDSVYNRPDFAEPVPEITGFCPRYWNPPYFPNCRYRLVFDTEPPRVWYVSTTGNDTTGDGSEVNPFRTIQKGIDVSRSGDTVLIEPGTYYENLQVQDKNVILASRYIISLDTSFISSTVIDGTLSDAVIGIAHSAGQIKGLTITNGFFGSGGGIMIYQSPATSGDSLLITNNRIIDNQACGIFTAESKAIITNNLFADNYDDYSGGGIYCANDSSVIAGNLFLRNSAPGGGAIGCQGGLGLS